MIIFHTQTVSFKGITIHSHLQRVFTLRNISETIQIENRPDLWLKHKQWKIPDT